MLLTYILVWNYLNFDCKYSLSFVVYFEWSFISEFPPIFLIVVFQLQV